MIPPANCWRTKLAKQRAAARVVSQYHQPQKKLEKKKEAAQSELGLEL